MTHDELVKFAAEKLNVLVAQKMIYERTEGDEDLYKNEWFEVDERGEIEDYFALSSPDLMLKGMGKVPDYILWDISGDKGDRYINFVGQRKDDTNAVRFWQKAEEIPLLFWQCWAEVEGWQG